MGCDHNNKWEKVSRNTCVSMITILRRLVFQGIDSSLEYMYAKFKLEAK